MDTSCVEVKFDGYSISPFTVIDIMATKGDFLLNARFTKNTVFPKLFAHLFAFNSHGKTGLLFASVVTVGLEPFSFLTVILLNDHYLCGDSSS